MTPMKRRGRKTKSGVLEMKSDIEKQVKGMALRAKDQVERKGNWVADKVEHAIERISQTAVTVDIIIDEELSK